MLLDLVPKLLSLSASGSTVSRHEPNPLARQGRAERDKPPPQPLPGGNGVVWSGGSGKALMFGGKTQILDALGG